MAFCNLSALPDVADNVEALATLTTTDWEGHAAAEKAAAAAYAQGDHGRSMPPPSPLSVMGACARLVKESNRPEAAASSR